MPSSIGQPQQPKQPSRKGKKAWRKNVDITEVQQGLESLREEIRQGGPVSEKRSDELFVVDTAGSEDIKKKHQLHKPLKVDEILAQRSAVPPVDGRKRPARVTDGILEPAAKRQRKDWVSKKEVQLLKKDLASQSHLQAERLEEDAAFDLWSAAPEEPSKAVEDDYIPKVRAKVAPDTIRRAPQPMTTSGRPVRAVQNPDAGTSYNPTFEAWDDLLNREGDREVEAEKKRLEQTKIEAEREARVAASALEAEREAEADYESVWEGFETENDEATLKKKRPERKTQSQRNKIKRRKENERLAKHEAAMGRKQKQTEEAIMAMIKAEQNKELAKPGSGSDEAEPDVDDTQLRRRKLGNRAIPEKHLEVVLPDELQESLRRLKPEGNLMTDRFRNLLVNGKLESRKPILQPKKRKVKVTEKWSYKDFQIKV
ncbi:uncharacterized protein HMPREF1541_03849 [Cyphellophora europaea CBS 101466]|uniref:Ribosome biogenesis protein NOP53 n=1 Tax=Cyphellophora europaea (strain CBS 101466) TaxID=1220924 RepID=W2S002_CYPE1|nr:uncharacterized protein HMPREF1541_03849 [Cyphellophora europaea CBS 101466]ETN41910.1 hypothetical protein HMPREF1541_03849 [Cyphellophora europaea CBS 101466]